MLAAKIIKDMGIDIIGLYCSMPFSLRDKSAIQPGGSLLQKFAAQIEKAAREQPATAFAASVAPLRQIFETLESVLERELMAEKAGAIT